jgi:hypothetical protein
MQSIETGYNNGSMIFGNTHGAFPGDKMKIFKYWKIEKENIQVDGNTLAVACYGGSNQSPEDASAKAHEKAKLIRQKILGEKQIFANYEVEIREEILQEISEKAMITRNRYGARVLNVEDQMILDIDNPPTGILNLFKKVDKKESIVKMVSEYASKSSNPSAAYRIYETKNGIRVFVVGDGIDPNGTMARKLFQDLHCDPLYALLCRKQKCYRARLTPKPSRIKMKAIKILFPRDENLAMKNDWIQQYEQLSQKYSVCKFVSQIGPSQKTDPIIVLHDELTGAFKNLPLA